MCFFLIMNLLRELETFTISFNKTRLLIWNLNSKFSQWMIRSSHRKCSIKNLLVQISQYLQKTPVMDSLFNQVAGLKVCNFIKKRFQQRCFSMKIAKLLKTPILKKICERLLLNIVAPNFSFICLKTAKQISYKCFITFTEKTPVDEQALVFSWQLSEIFNNDVFNTLKKSIGIRNVDQISIANLLTQRFTLNFAKISVFQVVKTSYIKSHQSKKSLKVVNNTLTIGFWWSLTCQNSYAGIS